MSKSIDDILADMEPQLARMREAKRRPVERIPEILALLQDIWEDERHQDARFFQLLYNIFGGEDHYQLEDTVIIENLSAYLKDIRQ